MEQQWSRMQGIKTVRSGFSVGEVAQFFRVSTRAVFKRLAAFAESGQNGLRAKDGAGRPSQVGPEQMQWIANTVRNNTPNQLPFDFVLWALRLIGQPIERQFGMTLSLPTWGKIMEKFGFTAQRLLYRAYPQDATGWSADRSMNRLRCARGPRPREPNSSLRTKPPCAAPITRARPGCHEDAPPSSLPIDFAVASI